MSVQRTIRRNIAANTLKSQGHTRLFSKRHLGVIRRRPIWSGISCDYYATSAFAKVWAKVFTKEIGKQARKKRNFDKNKRR